jgi:adenylate cyclase
VVLHHLVRVYQNRVTRRRDGASVNPPRPQKPSYVGYGMIALVVVASAAIVGAEFRVVELAERRSHILFYRLRGIVDPPEDIIVLAIDQASLNQGEFYRPSGPYADLEPLQAWPWQRRAYAIALERLLQSGARSVSLDILFLDPSRYGIEDDQALEQVLQTYGDRIVLAAYYDAAVVDENLVHQLVQPILWGSDDNHIAYINFNPGVDGRIYALPSRYYAEVIAPFFPDAIPSFAEASLMAAGLEPAIEDPQAIAELYYYGPGLITFRHIPFWEVIDPERWAVHQQQGTFENKLVLIGATTPTLGDTVRTPFDDQTPGIDLHATAIANLWHGQVITARFSQPHHNAIVAFVVVGLNGLWLCWGVRRSSLQAVGTIIFLSVWAGICYTSFVVGRQTLPAVVPLSGIALNGTLAIVATSVKSQIEQRRLRRTLERYVASPIVQEILARHSDDYQSLLKGKRLNATILFCDLRGFTTLSMNSDPETLVEQLNEYLDVMVDVILDAGGTVDKFIGDAIMAEFGSPISRGEYADTRRAIQAVLGMRQALAELQSKWLAVGKPILYNGMGLNFGEVLAGDIGSSRRREYAVIGDTVNVASRVEGMTRKFWTDILITESVYDWVKDDVDVVYVGEHPLKGRERNPVRLYTLVGWKGEDHSLYRTVHQRLREVAHLP